jgi:peptide/nickel transport system substrate-binding protein
MKLRRILSLAVALVMIFAFAAACQTDDPDPTDPTDTGPADSSPTDPTGDPTNPARDTLRVGYGAAFTGEAIYGFGQSAYDVSVRTLLHGFKGQYWVDENGEFHLNQTVVKNVDVADDAEGNRTYTFTLHEDLKWSDGSPITARCYIAALLFEASPQWAETGAEMSTGWDLIGHRAYFGGDSEYFAGAQLLGEFEYSLTIDGNNLPYFFEVGMVGLSPIFIPTYVPGIEIISDGNGVKFDRDITEDAERIAETERFRPTVVCGPYTFVSFENDIVTLQRNPYFKGDHLGRKPTIEFVVQMVLPDATAVDMLFADEVDLMPGEIMGDRIERVKAEDGFGLTSHLRNGYGLMNFVCDWGPTADRNVRWAIACLVDRNQLLDQILFGYGGLIDTEASEAQWMFQAKRAELQDVLIPIALNIDRANAYLDETEWRFEADGTTPFDASLANADGTYMRYNAEGQMLTIRHGAANAEIGAVLEIEFLKNTPLVGMNYEFEFLEWAAILDNLYFAFELPDEERVYSTFSMGTSFPAIFDPYFFSWHSDFIGQWRNSNQFSDSELDDLIMKMRRTTPGDNDTFLEIWFDYVVRWNYMLPALPLYANEYFNFFPDHVRGVNTSPFGDWYDIITEISVGN